MKPKPNAVDRPRYTQEELTHPKYLSLKTEMGLTIAPGSNGPRMMTCNGREIKHEDMVINKFHSN